MADGEFTTDDYFKRFARLHSDKDKERKPLVMEYEDGTPVGEEPTPEVDRIQQPPLRPVVASPRQPTGVSPPPSGCETSCEASCEFPTQASPVEIDDINAAMDRENEPPLPEQPAAENSPTAAESMQTTENQLEPGIAPPIPGIAPAPTPPAPQPSKETEQSTAPPPPQVNEAVSGQQRATPEQVMQYFGLGDQQILEITENWLKVLLDGKETFASRLDLGWTTTHLPSMKGHVTKLTDEI